MEIRGLLYNTVHRSRLSVEELADAIGCGASLLYRSANPNDPGAKFPIERLLPLMNATKNYSLLKHIASRAGYVLYKRPTRIKFSKVQDLNRFQVIFSEALQALLEFKDGRINRDQCLEKVDQLLSKTVEMRRSIEQSDQLSIEFEGD